MGGAVAPPRSAGIDVVVANVSALAIPDTEENWQASLNVDLMHTVRLVRAAMPHLERERRRVDHRDLQRLRSRVGLRLRALRHGEDRRSSATSTGSRCSWPSKGIRANTVSPGNTYFEGGVWASIETGQPGPLRDGGRAEPDRPHGYARERSPAPVVFLASPRARRVSGTNLVVDGALTRGIQL